MSTGALVRLAADALELSARADWDASSLKNASASANVRIGGGARTRGDQTLPRIDGFKPEAHPLDLNQIAQWRLDAMEVGEVDAQVACEEAIDEPDRVLAEYRYRLDQKRRALIRSAVTALISDIDAAIASMGPPASDDELGAHARRRVRAADLLSACRRCRVRERSTVNEHHGDRPRSRCLRVPRIYRFPQRHQAGARHRQCKHWMSRSVGVAEIATLKEQLKLWNRRASMC